MENKVDNKRKDSVTTGIILLLIGGTALAGQFMPGSLMDLAGRLFLLALGMLFIVMGIVSREDGWFIPGGILSGLGAGVAIVSSSLVGRLGVDDGGLFMLAFAGGWLIIPLLSAFFGRNKHLWALIPAAIMALVGLTVLYGGVFGRALEALGTYWPVALILAGILVVWNSLRDSGKASEKPVEKHS